MHVVTIPEPINMGKAGIFPAGKLIMEDRNAAEMMLQFPDKKISMVHLERDSRASWQDPHDKILIAGSLGMGDAIMLTPALRALKAKYPDSELYVSCFHHYREALLNLPYIDGFEEWPLNLEKAENYGAIYFVEGFLDHPKARTDHLSWVFAEMLNVNLIDNTTNTFAQNADYIPTSDETTWAWETFPKRADRKRLGLQVQASHRCRTYDAVLLRELMTLMIQSGWEVYLMGAPGEFIVKEAPYLHDLRIEAPRFRESAAFLLTCDAFVGPDSGFLHVAGALNIPAVGLFGAFPWKLRTQYYPSVFAIQGKGECSPCFHSPNSLQPPFPRGMPCAKTGKCEVLREITPERIKAKVEQITSLKPLASSPS